MPVVNIDAHVPGQTAGYVFDTIADFVRYPDLVATVRAVHVDPVAPDGSLTSRWEVLFRNGVLRWREIDRLDRNAGSIRFEQTEGDFDVFQGDWSIIQNGHGVLVSLQLEFDFGVASMASIIDPVATRVLIESITAVLRGLFGDEIDILHPGLATGASAVHSLTPAGPNNERSDS